ncbi:3D domain-containing protein [Solibacillus sp. FSL H8-0538]|uniref:3D domain-containing protein n=1 Tax=Solibacillus sp. FSL H8-0538 TaxID=2921400 RepID=UPI0030F6CE3D
MMIKKILTIISVLMISSVLFVSTTFAATHTIKPGETLDTLAVRYLTTVEKLMDLNGLLSNRVEIKQVIKLPAHIQNKPSVEAKKPIVDEPEAEEEKTFQVTATAYTAYCNGCSGITKTGINLRKNPTMKVIAVDPKVIPLGTKVWVEGYGTAIAGDTGGAIKGNKIDIFVADKTAAYNWGRRVVTVKILS